MKQLDSYILSYDTSGQQVTRVQKAIENSLLTRQKIVGGDIAIYPLTDMIDIIYREDFSMCNKQNAWMIYDSNGNEKLVLYGTILCLRYQEDNYASLTTKDYEIINNLIIPINIFKTAVEKNGKHIVYKRT